MSSRLESDIQAMATQLQALRKQGEVLGLFTDTRELLECSGCGLQEDVTAAGCLITHGRETSDVSDTGLRFTQLPNGRFDCPRCHALVVGHDPDTIT